MDRYKILEENFREAAAKGDLDLVIELISKGVNIDSKNSINGWTALHWAAKRSNKEIVRTLVDSGADSRILTDSGESAVTLATNSEVRALLGIESNGSSEHNLPIVPNYLKNPQLVTGNKVDMLNGTSRRQDFNENGIQHTDELVLKIRVANAVDTDFIEIELSKSELTYYCLLRTCCEELGLSASQVTRIRKLPDTIVRKDKDVQRLSMMQELEVVVMNQKSSRQRAENGYKSIQFYKNQTILY